MVKLYQFQKTNAMFLITALRKYHSAIDASDTGVGKTYVACQVIKELNVPTIILVPKSIIGKWKTVLNEFEITNAEVKTLEKFIYDFSRDENYKYSLKDKLIVWDECHKGQSNYRTKTAKIMAKLKMFGAYVLLLSATAISNPIRMRATSTLLDLCRYNDYFIWMQRNGCRAKEFGGFEFVGGMPAVQSIHEKIFLTGKGVRTRLQDIGAELPKNDVIIEPVEVEEEYLAQISEVAKKMREDKNYLLAGIGKMREIIENSKALIMADMADDLLEEGKSVVIFMSFLEAIENVKNELINRKREVGVITGELNEKGRTYLVEEFQANRLRCIICEIACGGVGLSLHDTDGKFPRVSLISPNFSAVHLKQALGRIYRVDTKSRCLQKIVVAKNTIEEKVIHKLETKLKELSIGNDGCLESEDLLEVFDYYKLKT